MTLEVKQATNAVHAELLHDVWQGLLPVDRHELLAANRDDLPDLDLKDLARQIVNKSLPRHGVFNLKGLTFIEACEAKFRVQNAELSLDALVKRLDGRALSEMLAPFEALTGYISYRDAREAVLDCYARAAGGVDYPLPLALRELATMFLPYQPRWTLEAVGATYELHGRTAIGFAPPMVAASTTTGLRVVRSVPVLVGTGRETADPFLLALRMLAADQEVVHHDAVVPDQLAYTWSVHNATPARRIPWPLPDHASIDIEAKIHERLRTTANPEALPIAEAELVWFWLHDVWGVDVDKENAHDKENTHEHAPPNDLGGRLLRVLADETGMCVNLIGVLASWDSGLSQRVREQLVDSIVMTWNGAALKGKLRHRSSEPDSLSDTTSRVFWGEDEEGR